MLSTQSNTSSNTDSIDDLKDLLIKISKEYSCDEIKVYYISEVDYCVKLIKDEKIINCFRRGKERMRKKHERRN